MSSMVNCIKSVLKCMMTGIEFLSEMVFQLKALCFQKDG